MPRKQMPRYKGKDIERWAKKRGWYFVRQTGDHRHYRHIDDPSLGTLTIPYTVSLNILKIIEKQVGERYGKHGSRQVKKC